jgi:DNA-binding CsgD family transcriptional regulator
MELLAFIEASNAASTEDALHTLYSRALHDLGYDRFIFSLMTDHLSLGLKAGHGVMQNYPDDWMKHYVAKGFEAFDPVRCFMFTANGPFIWDELPLVQDLSRKQQECLSGGVEAGLYNGAAVSMRGANGEIAGIGAASSTRQDMDPNTPYILNLLSQQFYLAYCTLMQKPENKSKPIYLTDREREVLTWFAKGKSSVDTADILGISYHGVEFHLKNVMRKLNTQNKTAAMVKALYNGLINL